MLKNKSSNKIIAKKVRLLQKNYEIANGLMFRKKLKENEAYYFKLPKIKKWDTHMFFVFQSLDLIFCLNGKVVELKENIKPFQLYFCKEESNELIETASGTIKRANIKIGNLTQYLKNFKGNEK